MIGFGVDIKKEDNKKDYSNYLGKYVRVSASNSTNYIGKIKSVNNDYTILNPSLIDLSCFDVTNYKISKEDVTINTNSIIAIEPVPRKYLEDIVKFAREKNKEKKSKK